jgi:hypothetical protein
VTLQQLKQEEMKGLVGVKEVASTVYRLMLERRSLLAGPVSVSQL